MKLLPALLISIGLIGAGVGIVATGKQGGKVPSREEISESIREKLLGIQNAGIKEVDCAPISGGINIEGSHCFVSTVTAEELLPQVKKALESVGSTPGWSNDYMVWGAFYAAKADPKRSFGVNITTIEGDRMLEGKAETKGYVSVVDFVVNSTRKD